MNFRGQIKNGVAVIDTLIPLPDGTIVRVAIEPMDSSFWSGKTIEELASEQGIEPIKNVEELAVDWPSDDSIDDFLTLIREVRH